MIYAYKDRLRLEMETRISWHQNNPYLFFPQQLFWQNIMVTFGYIFISLFNFYIHAKLMNIPSL